MKKFGLIGFPVKGSLSPLLFGAAYQDRYAYDLIEEPDFGSAFRKFIDGYDGVNVTAPFKEEAFRKADIIDPVCRKIGATNLLVKEEGGIHAYNSDYIGIVRSIAGAVLPDAGVASGNIQDAIYGAFGHVPYALVAGCGGAGRAAAIAAADLGFKTILTNRTPAKAQMIAESLPEYGFSVRPAESFPGLFWECDLIIYTVPGKTDWIGMIPGHIPAGREASPKFILEANYKTPSFSGATMSMLQGICPGLHYISGLDWLLHQAAGGYRLFTGEEPDFKAMEQALTNHL